MAAATESKMEIREVETGDEFRAVEELQREVWGIPDLEVVPASQLIASVKVGGVLLGAFAGEEMTGFIFGFTGYEEGAAIHHSHMLAVKPSFRQFNLGQRLKFKQRERVLDQGIDKMTWTFDPLQSRNAHINFKKLGVVSDRYLVNFYGEDAPSFLHSNGTDRLWVTWLLATQRVADRAKQAGPKIDTENLERLVELGDSDLPRLGRISDFVSHDRFVIEIPSDINNLQKRDFEKAVRWREATRQAFNDAISAGFMVEEFCRAAADGSRSSGYVLNRNKRLVDFE